MSVSQDVYNTIVHGIEGTDLQGVAFTTIDTNNYYGDPTVTPDLIPLNDAVYLYSDYSMLPNSWYDAAFTQNILTLEYPVDGVRIVNIRKEAASNQCYIDYRDAANNLVASDMLDSSWSCSRYYDNNIQPPTTYHASTVMVMLATGVNHNNELVAGFALCNEISPTAYWEEPRFTPYSWQVGVTNSGFAEQFLTDLIGDNIWDATPGGPGGESGPGGDPGGGDGIFHRNDIDIPYSNLPSISITDTGFVSLYKMSLAQLQTLAADLWDSNFFNSLAKNFADPFQNIISLGISPYEPTGTLGQVVIANYACPTSGEKLASNYFEIDCGNISVNEYYAHFGDYYDTKIQLYLPYCGTISINPSEVMSGTIGVKYLFDIFSGACMAQVMCYSGGAHHVLYQKEGNIKTELPITGANFAEYYKGLIGAVGMLAGAVGAAATGNAIAAGVATAGSYMTAASSKPSYERTGNVSGSAGLLGIQYPYLIFTTPNYFGGKSIGEKCGYISNLECTIGDETGFLQAEVDFEKLNSINAPIDVLKRIKQALAEGVYIEEVQ